MRVLVLGADGYLGWPTAMRFARLGHEVGVLDNMAKRAWELEVGARPLWPVEPLQSRVNAFAALGHGTMDVFVGDLTDYAFVSQVVREFRPDTIIHYAEQPSAPFSMMGREQCVRTQVNNVTGTLNLIWAMREHAPDAHLVKLGSMGEYGTPNIDIEEGPLPIEVKGRRDEIPFPKQPGSFYHLSKVHDSHNLTFAARTFGLRVTDLNQGIVYGTQTEETLLDRRLRTSVHYDQVFGTVLNRFCAESVSGRPLTVYGTGQQMRGFLNIRDTMQCVVLVSLNPARPGEFRVMNQFTEAFTILELAQLVQHTARQQLGLEVEIAHLENPRNELQQHYYNAKHEKLLELGLVPHHLTAETVGAMLRDFHEHRQHIDTSVLVPTVRWVRADPAPIAQG